MATATTTTNTKTKDRPAGKRVWVRFPLKNERPIDVGPPVGIGLVQLDHEREPRLRVKPQPVGSKPSLDPKRLMINSAPLLSSTTTTTTTTTVVNHNNNKKAKEPLSTWWTKWIAIWLAAGKRRRLMAEREAVRKEQQARKVAAVVDRDVDDNDVDGGAEILIQAVFLGSSLTMLHLTLDVLVHHQYAQEMDWADIGWRNLASFPRMFFFKSICLVP